MPRALDAHPAVTTRRPSAGRAPDGLGRPKAGISAARGRLQSSEPLWPWTAVRPRGIVNFFSISFGFIQNSFKFNSVELKSPQICSNRVFE
jgi:hypothetical protein